MYISLGKERVVADCDVIGIFDLDTCTVGKLTKEFLARAERENRLINAFEDALPLSFILCSQNVFLSGLSPTALRKRSASAGNKIERSADE